MTIHTQTKECIDRQMKNCTLPIHSSWSYLSTFPSVSAGLQMNVVGQFYFVHDVNTNLSLLISGNYISFIIVSVYEELLPLVKYSFYYISFRPVLTFIP